MVLSEFRLGEGEQGKGPLVKGILLSGGLGTRLAPITRVISKQLLPVFDKPMIYYPLSTLIHAGVNEVLIITSPEHFDTYRELLGNGTNFGISINYAIQDEPRGVAQAIEVAAEFLDDQDFWLILGDNLFHGPDFGHKLSELSLSGNFGCRIFAYHVEDPRPYGVIEFASDNQTVLGITEKPINPKSNWIVPGLYRFDSTAHRKFAEIEISGRGEYEITDLIRKYSESGSLGVQKISRGNAWFDLGSPKTLLAASLFVQTIQASQGLLIGSPEEAALHKNLLSMEQVIQLTMLDAESFYIQTLLKSIASL